MDGLAELSRDVASCRRCQRLVEWREKVAVEKRKSYRDDEYWGRPISGFGDAEASVMIIGLAPAAHGANRTGRVFTGDRSGDFLFSSLFRTGFANQPHAVHVDDGLVLSGAWVTAAVRCAPPANKPTPAERDACKPFLVRELELLINVKVIVALGQFGYAVTAGLLDVSPRPKFGHGTEIDAGDGRVIICSFHPSQQNTFTGRLTPAMIDAVFQRASELTR